MTPTHSIRRALMSGLAVAVVGCDVVQFASDPKPRVVETWNMPASTSTISVGKFLPAGVSIYSTPASNPPDSLGFSLTVATVNISQPLNSGGATGTGCTACVPLNGTNAIKPAFTLTATNSTALPNNVVQAAILSGQVALVITNNLTFDPLYVKNGGGAQGTMITTIKSVGGQVLGADTVTGAATNTFVGGKLVSGTFNPTTSLARTIALNTGNVSGSVTADIVFTSPVGDHNVPIDISKTVSATFGIPTLIVGSAQINVPLTNITPGAPTNLPKDLDASITDHVVSGALEMAITNPFTVAGTLNASFKYGPLVSDTVLRSFALPASTATPTTRTVTFDSASMVKIFKGNPTSLTMTGGVSSATPLTVTPKQQVLITNRLILGVRMGGN